MKDKNFNISIAGPAGFGIETFSVLLSLSFSRSGFYLFCTNEYEELQIMILQVMIIFMIL